MAKQGAMLRLTITISIVIIIIVYAIFNSRFLIKGPTLEIFDLVDGQIFSEENLVEINGRATNISLITLNDSQIFVDQSGYFSEKILLTDRLNTVEIYVEDKFGKSVREKLVLIYQK
jgi:hypothetical protein